MRARRRPARCRFFRMPGGECGRRHARHVQDRTKWRGVNHARRKRPCRRRLSAEEAPASRPCCEVICGGVRRRGRRRGRQRPGHAGECAVSDGKGGLARLWGGRGPFSSGKNGRAAQGPGQKCPGGNIRRRSGKEKSPWKHGGVRGVRASRAHDGVFFWGGESLRGDRRIRLHGLPEARVFRNTLFSN